MTCEAATLADTEIALLAALAQGLTHEQAARRLGISARTLRRHLDHACLHLGVTTPIQAIVHAVRSGLL